MTHWRLIETFGTSPALAMGLDEALLRSVGAPPTLRVYSWSPPALSLGYFQALDDVPAAADAEYVVRRITGGGAIHHHARELTFSVTIDARDPAYRGTTPESYERPHRAVIAALEELGVHGVTTRDESPSSYDGARQANFVSDRVGTGMCFHESTALDVGWEVGERVEGFGGWAKGVGTAQRRSDGRILHHGSIKLGSSPLEPGVATVEAATGSLVSPEVAARALVRAFGQEFDTSFETWTPCEQTLAEASEFGRRYGSRSFLESRGRRPRRNASHRSSRT